MTLFVTPLEKRNWRWWYGEKQDAWMRIRSRVEALRDRSINRRRCYREWARGYGQSIDASMVGVENWSDLPTYNYAKNTIDTWVAQHCKTRTLPWVLAKGGDFDVKLKARGMNRFIEAEFERCVLQHDPTLTRDSALFGTAAAYVGEADGQIEVVRIMPGDLDLDPWEWRDGQGRTLYWTRPIDRGQLAEYYPDQAAEIEMAQPAYFDADHSDDQEAWSEYDMVSLHYAWHLPSAEDADDGRFGMCIEGATLEWEDYEYQQFPIALMPRTKAIVGPWGDSLMADLISGQRSLDRMTTRIEDAMLLMGVPRVFVRKNAGINIRKINDEAGYIYECDDPTGIVAWNADPIHPAVIEHVQTTIQHMQAISGVSAMAARSEKPAGITAARALQLIDDTESERKIVSQRNREDFYVKIAQLILRVGSNIPGYETTAKNQRRTHSTLTIKLSDVLLPENEFVFDVMPTSFLAKTPAARMQQAEDLKNMGLLPPDAIANVLDIPDLETETSLIGARRDNIMNRIARILEELDGDAAVPDPMMDLQMAIKMIGDAYNKAQMDGVDEERLQMLRNFSVGCTKIMQQAAPPPGAGPPPPGPEGLPPGLPPPGGPLPPPDGMMPPGTPPMPPPMVS